MTGSLEEPWAQAFPTLTPAQVTVLTGEAPITIHEPGGRARCTGPVSASDEAANLGQKDRKSEDHRSGHVKSCPFITFLAASISSR